MTPVILRLTIDVASAHAVQIRVAALNDPERYAVEVSTLARRQFAKACCRVFDGLRCAAPPIGRD
jgi:hypothetical protein